jgi:sugar-phosphatase
MQDRGVDVRFRAILFDMDGVLIDSTGLDERSWIRWAAGRGMKDFRPVSAHGRRTFDTLRHLVPELDPYAETLRFEESNEFDCEGIIVFPGVLDLLHGLPERQWAIVTSCSERVMRHRLGFAGVPIPQQTVTGDRVERGKPDPESYRRGAAQLGFDVAECLVIEDSPHGIRAGKDAGCSVLAVASSHAREELHAADWIVDAIAEIAVTVLEDGWLHIEMK